MKTSEFKSIIKELVISEVKKEVVKEVSKQLPKLLFEMIGSQPKSLNNGNRVERTITEQSKLAPQKNTVQSLVEPPKVSRPPTPMKRYAKNPLLNQILNETTPGLPAPIDTGVPIPSFQKIGSQEDFGEESHLINEGFDSLNENRPQMEEPVSDPNTADLSKLFSKNFKAILDKSKTKQGGGFGNVLQTW